MNAKFTPNKISNRLWHILLMAILLILTSIACPGYRQIDENTTFLAEIRTAYSVVWSPTNEEVAISAENDKENISNIYVYNLINDSIQLIAQTTKGGEGIMAMDWSPDGEKLIISSSGGKIYEEGIWIIDSDQSDFVEYFRDGGLAVWSTTNLIAIEEGDYREDSIQTITVVNYLTGEEKVVYKTIGNVIDSMSWSPDGKELVFAMRDRLGNEDGNLFILSIETGMTQQLTTDKKNIDPELSPDGNMIAYIKKVEGDQIVPDKVLYIMNSDGSCETPVPGITSAWDPTWSPDGKKIAFLRSGEVYVVDLISIFGEEFLFEGMNCK